MNLNKNSSAAQFLVNGLAPVLALCLSSSLARAVENTPALSKPAQVRTKHYLTNALKLEVTPRGEIYFQNELDSVLSNLGVTLNEAYFSDIKWNSDKNYSLNDLKLDAETKQLVGSIRDTLNSWFVGFSLNNVKPSVEIGNSGYQAVFNRFAISTDEALLKQLNKKVGAVLVVEVDIKEIDVTATKVRAWDQNNQDLGKVGFDKVKFKIAGGQVPLQLRMPFYVTIDKQGIPQFEAVGISENIDKIDLEFDYGKVVIPTIQLVINGKVMPFNTSSLDKQFSSKVPVILQQLRSYLHKFASEQVPSILNAKAKQYLVQSLEEVKNLEAPGAPVGSKDQLLWGLQLKGINEDSGLSVDLNSFVEDPTNPDSIPSNSVSATRPPLMSALNKNQYDIGLSIDEGMINRMLQLSFQKRFFEKVPIDQSSNSKFLRLTQTPILEPVSSNQFTDANVTPLMGETFAEINLGVQVPPGTVTGIEKVVLQDNFEMKVKLVVKLLKNRESKAINIHLWDVIPNSVEIDSRFFTAIGRLAKGTITNKVEAQFADMAKQWRSQQTAIPGSVPVPSVLGLNLEIKHVSMESNGHLILYLDYAKVNTQSLAKNPQPFPSIMVENLSAYDGKYLSIYYASARPSGVGLNSSHLSLDKVYRKIADIPIVSNQVQLQPENIPWQGFAHPNVVLLVVHNRPNFTWLNQDPDGSQPAYLTSTSLSTNTSYVAVSTIWSHNFTDDSKPVVFRFIEK